MYLTTFGVALIVAAVAAPRVAKMHRLWVVATASYLLMYWFGSGSSDEYLPLPLTHRRMLMAVLPGVLVLAALASEALPWHRRWVAIVGAATVLPFVGVLAYVVLRDRPETTLYAAIREETGDVLVVCPDFRCLSAVPFAFGFRVPPRMRVTSVTDFVDAPPPTGARVRVVVKPRARANLYGGVAIVQPIEALHLPAIVSHRTERLYDAGDGADLHRVLRATLRP
jgi:hypothetical protein